MGLASWVKNQTNLCTGNLHWANQWKLGLSTTVTIFAKLPKYWCIFVRKTVKLQPKNTTWIETNP